MKRVNLSFFKTGFFTQYALIQLLLSVMFFVCLTAEASAKSFSEFSSHADFQLIPVSEHPLFGDDLDFVHLKDAIRGSVAYYRNLPSATLFSFGKEVFSADHMIQSLKRFLVFIEKNPSSKELNTFIDQYFNVYASVKNGEMKSVLFTGYYEPLLHGSIDQTAEYRYPVYSRPRDLVQYNPSHSSVKTGIGRDTGNGIVPYYNRQQIKERGASGINASPIAWVNDPIALFFLHVQGSGKIRFKSGDTVNVHYAISNGRPYKSIGKYLIDKKKLSKETVSMQSIREYLKAHPDEVDEILNYNPRYIFFETREKGPKGCFNIELTPGRSLALDRQAAPAGSLVFIQAEKPEVDTSGKIRTWVRFSRFLLNQDTGSAIKGPGRADIFWGNGPYAELAAGYMKQAGQLYFIVLKQ